MLNNTTSPPKKLEKAPKTGCTTALINGHNPQKNWQILAKAVSLPYLMDQQELAAYLGKSTAWCERARWAGEGPAFVKLGRHVRYRADDVMAWIEANLCATTEAAQ